MRKFLHFQPNDPQGLYQLYALLKERKNDSAFFYLEKAYALDTANQFLYNARAWEFFETKNYSKALKMAQASQTKYGLTNDLLPLEAYAAFSIGNFEHAANVADRLVTKFPEDVSFQMLKTKAKILGNTPSSKITQDGFTFRLTEYNQNMSELDTWSTIRQIHIITQHSSTNSQIKLTP
jgi:tetratricopeptide (TPR) repeat protein